MRTLLKLNSGIEICGKNEDTEFDNIALEKPKRNIFGHYVVEKDGVKLEIKWWNVSHKVTGTAQNFENVWNDIIKRDDCLHIK